MILAKMHYYAYYPKSFFEGSISTDYLGDISQVVGAVYLLHM